MVETQEFYDLVKEEYDSRVYTNLLQKKYFTKVEALEIFTNFWSVGRTIRHYPKHNFFNPVATILQRPKFRDYRNEDTVGSDFDFRTHEEKTPQSAVVPASTLRPEPFQPAGHEKVMNDDAWDKWGFKGKWAQRAKHRRLSQMKSNTAKARST